MKENDHDMQTGKKNHNRLISGFAEAELIKSTSLIPSFTVLLGLVIWQGPCRGGGFFLGARVLHGARLDESSLPSLYLPPNLIQPFILSPSASAPINPPQTRKKHMTHTPPPPPPLGVHIAKRGSNVSE